MFKSSLVSMIEDGVKDKITAFGFCVHVICSFTFWRTTVFECIRTPDTFWMRTREVSFSVVSNDDKLLLNNQSVIITSG